MFRTPGIRHLAAAAVPCVLCAVLCAHALALPQRGTEQLLVWSAVSSAAKAGSGQVKKARPAARSRSAYRPCRRNLAAQEISRAGFFQAMEQLSYRMCLQEVPFFLALHQCFYKDERLDRKDTLVLKKRVMQSLLAEASKQLSSGDLTISPATSIDSMWLFRAAGKRGGATTNCNIAIFTRAGSYEIPKTGASIAVPAVVKAAIVKNERDGSVTVTIFSRGVKLELPGYAKILSFGMLSDMDISYAELRPVDPAFEARLLYAPKEKDVARRGWSFNITECNKIRPYER